MKSLHYEREHLFPGLSQQGGKVLKFFVAANRSAAAWLERRLPSVFVGESYKEELDRRIARDIEGRSPDLVLEAGGIDRPLLVRGRGFTYIGLDIEERPECYIIYDKFFVRSIEKPLKIDADLVISITLLEHVQNNSAAVNTIFEALKPGGTTHHYVPSKWHPYSIALRMVGPSFQKRLIAILRPNAVGVTGYPAYFDHCSPGEFEGLLRQHGFIEIDLKPFYRAADYFAFFLPAYVLVSLFENLCAALNWRIFASGFVVSAVRPMSSTEGS